jgi:hypothetical protein
MRNPEDHYNVVYICTKSQHRIVSMTHQSLDKAKSMVTMLNQYTLLGHFRVEDEWEQRCEQEQAA